VFYILLKQIKLLTVDLEKEMIIVCWRLELIMRSFTL